MHRDDESHLGGEDQEDFACRASSAALFSQSQPKNIRSSADRRLD